jgi:hypothetical protein
MAKIPKAKKIVINIKTSGNLGGLSLIVIGSQELFSNTLLRQLI